MKKKRSKKRGLDDFFDTCPNRVSVTKCPGGQLCFNWSQKGVGFGQLYLWSEPDGRLGMDTECSGDALVLRVIKQAIREAKREQ